MYIQFDSFYSMLDKFVKIEELLEQYGYITHNALLRLLDIDEDAACDDFIYTHTQIYRSDIQRISRQFGRHEYWQWTVPFSMYIYEE